MPAVHRPVPVLSITSVDPVLRDAVASSLLCDLPGSVVMRHDLTPRPGTGSSSDLARSVYDLGGARERALAMLGHGCPTCALQADVLPVIERLVTAPQRPAVLVLALPVAVEALPVVRALTAGAVPGAVAAGVVATVDGGHLLRDLLGDHLLAERGLEHSADDRRAVGEVLAHQLEQADMVAAAGQIAVRPARLVAHLAPPGTHVRPVEELDGNALLLTRRAPGDPRGDLLRASPSGAPDGEGVATIDLRSWRPMHPARLLDRLAQLGTGPLRSRGRFWLPTRPADAIAWDGAGGQLSIGVAGTWQAASGDPMGMGYPGTRLVVTAVGDDPARVLARVRRAFEAVLLSDAELARGLAWWCGRRDDLDPWLGPQAFGDEEPVARKGRAVDGPEQVD